jgi:hypothetical protein
MDQMNAKLIETEIEIVSSTQTAGLFHWPNKVYVFVYCTCEMCIDFTLPLQSRSELHSFGLLRSE